MSRPPYSVSDLKSREERLRNILYGPHGLNKVAASIVTVLENTVPPLIRDLKGTNGLILLSDAHKILAEEMNKGDADLFLRLRKRIDSYWIGE